MYCRDENLKETVWGMVWQVIHALYWFMIFETSYCRSLNFSLRHTYWDYPPSITPSRHGYLGSVFPAKPTRHHHDHYMTWGTRRLTRLICPYYWQGILPERIGSLLCKGISYLRLQMISIFSGVSCSGSLSYR